MKQKYAKIRLKRIADFDGETNFVVLLNDEVENDFFGTHIFPQGFKIGKEITLICIHECHLKEQD